MKNERRSQHELDESSSTCGIEKRCMRTYIICFLSTSCPQKNKPEVFDLTVIEFRSNLAFCIIDKCLTMRHKSYPLHLMYMYVHYLVKL